MKEKGRHCFAQARRLLAVPVNPPIGSSKQDALRLTESRFADGRRIHPLMLRYLRRECGSLDCNQSDLLRLGASYFDEPEPSLAILGPPAITRLMFELWVADRWVSARFDLKNPLHRRDYLLWLQSEGNALELDQQSITAAMAIMRRGICLLRVPPRWPSQASLAMAPGAANVDAWLAEPISRDLGARAVGIPMPRTLALLWELRQDVRLHFANRSRAEILDYLAWCLTQGIHDRCVAVELVEPALAGFLDALDPELSEDGAADSPPVTRLLRIMAPLYDGPFPDFAREFPHGGRARFCVAVWACGLLRRRHAWPESFVGHPLRWLLSGATKFTDAFLTLNNLGLGLWGLRPDLQRRCDLATHEGRSALLEWLADTGAEEFDLDDCMAPAFAGFRRPPRGRLYKPAIAEATEGVIRRDLCLVGYAGLVSGRAEDLRMSALALDRQNRHWAMLDRLSGAITTRDGRLARGLAEPPLVNLLHLNADTAFFDYLFLRERGFAQSYTIGYWAWELARFPEDWLSSFAFVQEIWVASRFAYEAIAPATTKPVLLMPMAVAVPQPEPGLKRGDLGLPDDKFVFLFSFDFRSYASRKNPLAAVAAFRQAFPRRSAPVCLVLKTMGGDWQAQGRDRLVDAIGDDPRIRLIDRQLSRPRAMALLALSDCFLSLHRSEGFGRGPAEAMLMGKPVITTDYSGTRDFATCETALPIGYRLVPVGASEYPGADGQVWAEADTDEAARAMRRIVGDSVLAERLGDAGRGRIRELYDPALIGARYVKRCAAIAGAM
jgi:glycosyltransferase involved in cell wall biosynthesis